MKKLVVFYSLEGHTKLLAEVIAEETGAELARVTPKDDDVPSKGFMKYLKGGSQVMRKAEPEILPLTVDPKEYDLVFIGCPVWAGGYVPALRTLFAQWELKGKKVALFTGHRGGKGTALEQMAESLKGNEVVAMKDFNEKNGIEANAAEAVDWVREILD